MGSTKEAKADEDGCCGVGVSELRRTTKGDISHREDDREGIAGANVRKAAGDDSNNLTVELSRVK